MCLRAIVIALFALLPGCARVYTLRVGAGVERAAGEYRVQVAVTAGFAGNVGGRHYIAPVARAGLAVREVEPVVGLGVDWLLALRHMTFRAGPDYLVHKTFDNDTVFHALGGRVAALVTLSNELGSEQNGLVDELFKLDDPTPALVGVGSNALGDDRQASAVRRRHSIGIESAGGYVVAGEGRSVTFLGLVYENDVVRVPNPRR